VADKRTIARQVGITVDELDETIARARRMLLKARSTRIRPGCDDKVLASWNGLMVRGIAEAARAFGNQTHRVLAIDAATFLFETMVRDGRVFRSFKDGRARIAGYLEDHAALGLAALSIYELTFDEQWLNRARDMGTTIVQWFWDDTTGAFYDTASDHETLITRPREITDNATPSGTSLAVELLVRLAELLHDVDARRRATYVVETLAPAIHRYPGAFGHLLGAADMLIRGAVELAIVGDPAKEDFAALVRAAGDLYVPGLVIAGGPARSDDKIALLAERPLRDGRATAYVCKSYTCDEPTTDAAVLGEQLERASAANRS
jgi:uncharacterized protein YyaL (SSP411 family)